MIERDMINTIMVKMIYQNPYPSNNFINYN